MKASAIAYSAVLAAPAIFAHKGHHHERHVKRQAVETVDGNVIPPISALTSGYPFTPTTTSLAFVPSAGTAPPIAGAPPLPDLTGFDATKYPTFGQVPPVDSPEVQAWLKELDGHDIPNYPPNKSPVCTDNPEALADRSRGWWTCHKYSAPDDVETCPDKMTWGLTFDDGPAIETPRILNYLNSKNLKATFYVIGCNVVLRPHMLQAEYIAGHEIAVHTWSHTALTTQTTAQIVAELGWTRKVIKDVIGVTPNTMRPPQGDMDNRVRAISKAMGLTPVIWARNDNSSFDSQDWEIHSGQITGQKAWDNFEAVLATAESRSNGFISLQHDVHPETVDFAMHVLPAALATNKYKITSVVDCLKKPLSEAYRETDSQPDAKSSATVAGIRSEAWLLSLAVSIGAVYMAAIGL